MRGLLALLVALSHAAAVCALVPTTTDYFQSALTPFLMFSGFNYVLGFIVISGYCIARSTIAQPFRLRAYAALRVTRIYPALIACVMLAAVVEMCLLKNPARIQMWSYGIDTQHFLFNLAGFRQFGSMAPTYTVTYELFYYLAWGCALAVIPRRLVLACLALAMAALLLIIPVIIQFAVVLSLVWIMGAALAVHQIPVLKLAHKCPLWITWALFVVVLVWGNSELARNGISVWDFPGSLATIPCGALFVFVIASHLSRPGQKFELDDWLGEISYPLFLAHGPTIIAVGSTIKAMKIPMNFGPLCLLLMASSIVVAQIILVAVDRPVMFWRRRLRAATGAPAVRAENVSALPEREAA